MSKIKKPELLAPAGNLEKLKVGLLYGADAFYMGLPTFSMRSRTNNFTKESVLEGISLIRKADKKFYITANIYPRGIKVDAFKKHIEFLRDEIKPDGVIVADDGVFDMFREYAPKLALHMSVQANLLNYRAVNFWKKQGAVRVILPRELMLSEIKEIHENVKDIEIECFVHGAICVAYSGRCLISNYLTGRDANQGICAHSCRWKYTLHNDLSKKNRENMQEDNLYLEEEKRPKEFMPIEEDENGTYLLNSKDMCLLPYLQELVESGVCSFKIEGRNKTEFYLATVVKAYRKAIDDMMAGRKFDESLLGEVKKTANRGFIPGFLFGFPGNDSIYYKDTAPIEECKFIGIVAEKADVKNLKGEDLYEVEIRNRVVVGDEVEIVTPTDCFKVKITSMFDMEGVEITSAHGGAGNKIIKLKKGIEKWAMIRMVL
ncbi:MAG: U32 family peptidase C-terminal domain-containing protein [Candidatus Gracilibacteria bacterium]|jgi:putative protease